MEKLDNILGYAKMNWQVSQNILDEERKQTELMQEIRLELRGIREERKTR